MKTKEQWIASAWIPIERRRPPVDKTWILVWHPGFQEVFVWRAYETHQLVKALLGEIELSVAEDKRITHWMKVVPPC